MTAAFIYQALTEFTKSLEDDYNELEDTSYEQLTVLLAAVRDCRADLKLLYDKIEQEILGWTQDRKRYAVEGLGEVEVKSSARRTKWQHHELIKVLTARALDERAVDDDGVAEPGWEAVSRVLEECMLPSWRTTALKRHGVDPDEYCETDEYHRSIKLPARQT